LILTFKAKFDYYKEKTKTEISTVVHILLLYKKLFAIISHISNRVRVIKLAQGL